MVVFAFPGCGLFAKTPRCLQNLRSDHRGKPPPERSGLWEEDLPEKVVEMWSLGVFTQTKRAAIKFNMTPNEEHHTTKTVQSIPGLTSRFWLKYFPQWSHKFKDPTNFLCLQKPKNANLMNSWLVHHPWRQRKQTDQLIQICFLSQL